MKMQNEIDESESVASLDRLVSGEVIEAEAVAEIVRNDLSLDGVRTHHQALYVNYIYLPFVFLTVSLLGGLRFSGVDSSFIFLTPALICLVFALILLILFFRAGLITVNGWFSDEFSALKNLANGTVILMLFSASAQVFNSLIPEQGLPFWVVAFCFFWVLWNNLFADFDTKKLLRSLGALFGLAFVAKYMLLTNLAAPVGRSWLQSVIENPAQEAMTWLLDLPRFSSATGYVQFFAVLLFLLGLFLMPSSTPYKK